MSVNKLKLPDFLIADLYKNSLVSPISAAAESAPPVKKEKPEISPREEEQKGLHYLGENRKNVTVLVNQTSVKYLNDGDLTFLTNILKACQLSLPDIAIVNTAKQSLTYSAITEKLTPAYLLLFDVAPSVIQLPFTIPQFQVQQYNSCTIMFAPPLANLNKPTADGRLLKSKLWMSLKQVFNI